MQIGISTKIKFSDEFVEGKRGGEQGSTLARLVLAFSRLKNAKKNECSTS